MGKAFKLDNEVLASSISTLSGNLDTHAAKAASSSALGHVKTGTGITNSSGTISVSYGTAAGTACQGNDSRLSNSRTPVAHATSATTYGGGTASNYGHVKLSDSYTSSGGAASASVAASSKAVYDAYTALKNSFQAGVDTIYNAFVKAGTTPTAKTPAALSTAVTTLKNESISDISKLAFGMSPYNGVRGSSWQNGLKISDYKGLFYIIFCGASSSTTNGRVIVTNKTTNKSQTITASSFHTGGSGKILALNIQNNSDIQIQAFDSSASFAWLMYAFVMEQSASNSSYNVNSLTSVS